MDENQPTAAGKPGGTLAGKPRGIESGRHGGFRAAGAAVAPLTRPIVAKRGGIVARLKAEWREIVGCDWADITWPETLGRDGGLKLRVAPGRALELQHRVPLLIERLNLFFGRTLVARISLIQAPLPLAPPRPPPVARTLGPAEARVVDARVADIADAELRDALALLGRAVLAAGDDTG